MKNRKGFTLVELVVVIAILGILAAIAVPKLMESRTAAADSAHNSNVAVLESAATMLVVKNGLPKATITWSEATAAGEATKVNSTGSDGLGWGPFLQKWPATPKGGKIANDAVYKVIITDAGVITVDPVAVELK